MKTQLHDDVQNMLTRHKTLFVSNIQPDATRESIEQCFQTCATIRRVYLAKDRRTLRCRGYAYVTFSSHDEAKQALQTAQGQQNLKLSWPQPKRERYRTDLMITKSQT